MPISLHMSKNDSDVLPKIPIEVVDKFINFTLRYVFSKCFMRGRYLFSFR